MALISLNPHTIYEVCYRIAKNENKYAVVINNHAYHALSDDKKATVKAYYVDQDPNDAEVQGYIIPEAEIDAVFEAKDLFYFFNSQQQAVDAVFDWFPQPQNLPDADHHIKAYVIAPNGTIPYINNQPIEPPAGG